MIDTRDKVVLAYLQRSRDLLDRAMLDHGLIASIIIVADCIAGALRNESKLLLAGNGGSASDAQHIAAEFTGRYKGDRRPLAAIALTADTSVLTGIGNDYGFEQVFARQVRALGHRGDVFVGISTSGKSPNIISALQTARELGLITVGFTKAGPTPMGSLCDLLIPVPSEEVGLIQQIHITAAHAICNLVERALFGDTGSDT